MLTSLIVILTLLMIVVASVLPVGSELSDFELTRRVDSGDKAALGLWRRKDLYQLVMKLQWSLQLIILVMISVLASAEFGQPLAIVLAVIIGLWHQQLARLIHRLTQPQYRKFEHKLLSFTERIRPLLKTTFVSHNRLTASRRIASRQELLHVIEQADELTSSSERSMMAGSLKFEHEIVKDHMTPRGLICSVAAEEMIGPLVLDDLHKTGQSSFVVRDGDIDHIIGTLHIHDLVNLNNKTSATARDLMTHAVNYIDQESTIAEALDALVKTQAAMLVVRSKDDQTTGLFSLADASKVLLGN